MISSEEAGIILARLAIADEAFLQCLLRSAQAAEDRLLPGDLEKLETWAMLMRALRASIAGSTPKINNEQK